MKRAMPLANMHPAGARLGLRVSREEAAVLKFWVQTTDLVSVRAMGSPWEQGQGICYTAEMNWPAFASTFARLLAAALKIPSLVF